MRGPRRGTPSTPISGSTRLSLLPGATQNAVVLRGQTPILTRSRKTPLREGATNALQLAATPGESAAAAAAAAAAADPASDFVPFSPSTRLAPLAGAHGGSAAAERASRRRRPKPPPPMPLPIPMAQSIVRKGDRPAFERTHGVLAVTEREGLREAHARARKHRQRSHRPRHYRPVPPLASAPGEQGGRRPQNWWGSSEEARLRHALATARRRDLPRLERRVDKELRNAQQMLPLNDVIAGSERLAVALATISRVFKQAMLGHVRRAVGIWWDAVIAARRAARHCAATHIERIVRGRKGRLRALRRRKKRNAFVHKQARRYWKGWKRLSIVRVVALFKMQAMFRTARERKTFQRIVNAASTIERWWRCLKAVSFAKFARAERARRLGAAQMIQRSFRGFLVRRDVTSVARLQKELTAANASAEDYEQMMRLHFTQLGACLKVQAWYRIWHVKHANALATHGRMFIGHVMATHIQRRFRGRKGRAAAKIVARSRRGEMRVARLRWYIDTLEPSDVRTAAARAQSIGRGWFGRRKAIARREELRLIAQRRQAKRAEHAALSAAAAQTSRGSLLQSLGGVGRSLKYSIGGGALASKAERDAAVMLQCAWRRQLAQRAIKAARRARKLGWVSGRRKAALMLQTRWREAMEHRRNRERIVDCAARLIQRMWRGCHCRRFERNRKAYLGVAVNIQSAWRVRQARLVLRELREEWALKMSGATDLQRVVRGSQGRRIAWERHERRFYLDEVSMIGAAISKHTAVRLECSFIMEALKKRDADSFADGTVQSIFWHWTAANDGNREHGVEGRITGNQFSKMLRAIPGMIVGSGSSSSSSSKGGKGGSKKKSRQRRKSIKGKGKLKKKASMKRKQTLSVIVAEPAGEAPLADAAASGGEEDSSAVEISVIGGVITPLATPLPSPRGEVRAVTPLISPRGSETPSATPRSWRSPLPSPVTGDGGDRTSADATIERALKTARKEKRRQIAAEKAEHLAELQRQYGPPLTLNRPEVLFAKACGGSSNALTFKQFTKVLRIIADERLFMLDEDPAARKTRLKKAKEARAKKRAAAKIRKEKEAAAELEAAQMAAEYAASHGGQLLASAVATDADAKATAAASAAEAAAAKEAVDAVVAAAENAEDATPKLADAVAKEKELGYSGHRDSDARVLFLIDHFFLRTKWAKRYLADRFGPADRTIDTAVLQIQGMRRNCNGRQLVKRLTVAFNAYAGNRNLVAAAKLMQAAWRRKQARNFLVTVAMKTYKKSIDADSGVAFYTNMKTGEMMWEKPPSFGTHGDVELGDDAAEEVKKEVGAVICFRCKEKPAAKLCIECTKSYCAECHIDRHKKKSRIMHEWVPIEACVECESPAVRRCTADGCGDSFCNSCWDLYHWKGPLAKHRWEPLIPMCESCSWQRPTRRYSPGGEQCLCISCFDFNYPGAEFDLILFTNNAVQEKIDLNAAAKEAARLAVERVALDAERKANAVLLVSSMARMILVRIKIGRKVDEAREKVRAKFAEQAKLESSFAYRMKKKLKVTSMMKKVSKKKAKTSPTKEKSAGGSPKASSALSVESAPALADAAGVAAAESKSDSGSVAAPAAEKKKKKRGLGALLGKVKLPLLKSKTAKANDAAAKEAESAAAAAAAASPDAGAAATEEAEGTLDGDANANGAAALAGSSLASGSADATTTTWTAYRDPSSGSFYFYNAIDGTTTWDRPAGPNDVIVDDTEATEYGTDYGTDYASGYDTGDASGYESAGGGYDEDPDWVQYFDEEGNAYMSQTSTGEYYYL